MALTQACKKAIWVNRCLTKLSTQTKLFDIAPITIYADNQGIMALAKSAEFQNRTKHISIQYYLLREMVNC